LPPAGGPKLISLITGARATPLAPPHQPEKWKQPPLNQRPCTAVINALD